MNPQAKEITQFTESIWSSMLGLMVQENLTGGEAMESCSSETSYVATVGISGEWNGAISVECSRTLAARAAAAMFQITPAEVSDEDLADSLGEMANMIGGNLKALLPAPSDLSLPKVESFDGEKFKPTLSVITQASFECEGEAFKVYLLRQA